MSKDKKNKVSLRDLEGEIVRLEADEVPRPETPGLKELFGDLLQQQAHQHAELMKTFTEFTKTNNDAVVKAVKDSMKADPPARVHSVSDPLGLFSDDIYEHSVLEGAVSSDEENDFRGWFPEPGQAVHQEQDVVEPVVQLPSTSAQAASGLPDAPQPAPSVPEGLFSQDKPPNWDPPVDLMSMC